MSSNDWIDRMNSNANSPTWNCFRTGKKKKKGTRACSIDHAALLAHPRALERSGNRSRAAGCFRSNASRSHEVDLLWDPSQLGNFELFYSAETRYAGPCDEIIPEEGLIINFNRLRSVYFKTALCLIVILFICNIKYVQYIVFFCEF